VLLATRLPETRPPHERRDSSWSSALADYRQLLRDPHFLGLTLIGGFGIASFFAYLANSSFVLIGHYGLSTRQYGLAFAANAAAFIGASQMTARLGERFGLALLARAAAGVFAAVMVLLLALRLAGLDSLALMLVLLFIGYGFLGLVVPTSMVLAMEAYGAIAGTASALAGTLHFATGIAVMALLSPYADGAPLPMLAGIACCAALTFVLAWRTLRPQPSAVTGDSAGLRGDTG
jgi:DHA1 family bicyclomycin/chloramphenicol resistance-like MFS transporter